ncbi:MAG: hypothetical protein CMG46_11200 [Candidatus Marinimicrobia bacterium]|nr:hypothetical protein [Candidatus Neomarinimicrobiota bacterium]
MSRDDQLRGRCQSLFKAMLLALGSQNYSLFQSFLDESIVCEWPYQPMPGYPKKMGGAVHIRKSFERDMEFFTPYSYTIKKFYELSDPEVVVAEYESDCKYLPRNLPYRNSYLGIITFRSGKIVHWKEYVNPLPILNVVGADQTWSEKSGVIHEDRSDT